MKTNIIINIPLKINILLWKNKDKNKIINISLINKYKKFNFYAKKQSVFIDKWCNSIEIKKCELNKNIKTINFFSSFLKSWDEFFFKKIKFKGKGFRIKFFKNFKLVKFFFGKSHKTFVLFKKMKIKRINKYKFIVYNINKNKLPLINSFIKKIKPLNFYTLRGLRLSKQIIFKRKGKKGTYI